MRPTIAAATAALLALAACGGEKAGDANLSSANQSQDAAGPGPAAAARDPAAPPPAEAAVGAGNSATAASPSGEIRALLIGRWTDDGNCAAATEFRADGTFDSMVGNGRWTLENEYLTLAGAGPDAEVAIQEIDRTEMATVSPTGRIGRWTRC